MQMAGRPFTIRYIGIDTPGTADPGGRSCAMAKEAARPNAEPVEGKAALLAKDVLETDRYGRLLRYVWVEGRMINAVLVEEGFARVYTMPPHVRYAGLSGGWRGARELHRGLWGRCPASGSPA